MSDATLPPLRSSSVGDIPTLDRFESFSSENDACPSSGNSQDAAFTDFPSEGSDEKKQKQKRKRTSAEDQAKLEKEYKRNPKPDKTARLEIVKHVAMCEKEVQIWFQNRRQNTRRKSRPLLPHEIAAFGLGGMAALSSDPISSSIFSSSQPSSQPPSFQPEEVITSQSLLNQLRAAANQSALPITKLPEQNTQEGNTSPESPLPTITPLDLLGDLQSSPTTRNTTFSHAQVPSQAAPALTPGYLSNRRHVSNSSYSTPTVSQMPSFSTPSSTNDFQPKSCPARIFSANSLTPSSSQVRLSMSLDGRAELVPTEFTSPQKPHPQRPLSSNSSFPRRQSGGLQRSQSAFIFGRYPKSTSSAASSIPSLLSGRSRDARTWEFCCDADARDELTTQAENESSGSAIAAISLIRSTSISALKPNSSKRNVRPPTEKRHGKKLKLGRTSSSVGRLQTTDRDYVSNNEKPALNRITSGDSDKENWAPDEGSSTQPRRRPLPSAPSKKHNRRRVLEDSMVSASSFGGSKRKRSATTGPDIFEDGEDTAVDAEVEKFMRGEVSPSKKGDLDCIQGLLSLSQGNWR